MEIKIYKVDPKTDAGETFEKWILEVLRDSKLLVMRFYFKHHAEEMKAYIIKKERERRERVVSEGYYERLRNLDDPPDSSFWGWGK